MYTEQNDTWQLREDDPDVSLIQQVPFCMYTHMSKPSVRERHLILNIFLTGWDRGHVILSIMFKPT